MALNQYVTVLAKLLFISICGIESITRETTQLKVISKHRAGSRYNIAYSVDASGIPELGTNGAGTVQTLIADLASQASDLKTYTNRKGEQFDLVMTEIEAVIEYPTYYKVISKSQSIYNIPYSLDSTGSPELGPNGTGTAQTILTDWVPANIGGYTTSFRGYKVHIDLDSIESIYHETTHFQIIGKSGSVYNIPLTASILTNINAIGGFATYTCIDGRELTIALSYIESIYETDTLLKVIGTGKAGHEYNIAYSVDNAGSPELGPNGTGTTQSILADWQAVATTPQLYITSEGGKVTIDLAFVESVTEYPTLLKAISKSRSVYNIAYSVDGTGSPELGPNGTGTAQTLLTDWVPADKTTYTTSFRSYPIHISLCCIESVYQDTTHLVAIGNSGSVYDFPLTSSVLTDRQAAKCCVPPAPPCEGCIIKITDGEGTELVQTGTNANGEPIYEIPASGICVEVEDNECASNVDVKFYQRQ